MGDLKRPRHMIPNFLRLEAIEKELERLTASQETILSKLEYLIELQLENPLEELNEEDKWDKY